MNDKQLKETLRQWDPAATHSLHARDRDEIRERMLAENRTSIVTPYRLAAALAIIAFVGIAGLVFRSPAMPSTAHRPPAASAPASVDPEQQKLQIHYATPGGTRIVWTMDPAFSL